MSAGTAFAYHRSVAPMLWLFVAIALTEMVVVHGVIALRWPWVGLAMTAVTLPVIVWLVVAIRAMPRYPVLLEGGRLVMRVGPIKRLSVSLSDVAGAAAIDGLSADRRRGTLNLALIAAPNVLVELARPMGRRGRTAIAHRLDEPARFLAALAAAREAA